MKKFTFIEVKEFFEKENCILLSKEYKGSLHKLDYICSCGNKSSIIFSSFKRGTRCRSCGGNYIPTILEVYEDFRINGCILLSKEYTNCYSNLDYICSCGTLSKILYYNFKGGARCQACATDRWKLSKYKFKTTDVKQAFYQLGLELLEYNGLGSYFTYRCNCGNTSKAIATPGSLFKPRMCETCLELRRANYEHRGTAQYFEWAYQVKIRDAYSCKKCTTHANPEAHHIFSWHKFKDLRYDIDNGITLCFDCHKKFHRLFGNYNTDKDLVQFLS